MVSEQGIPAEAVEAVIDARAHRWGYDEMDPGLLGAWKREQAEDPNLYADLAAALPHLHERWLADQLTARLDAALNRAFETTPEDDVECRVIAAALTSANHAKMLVEFLTSKEFFDPRNATIFEAITRLLGDDLPADVTTVLAHLTDTGRLDDAGGEKYLSGLLDMGGRRG